MIAKISKTYLLVSEDDDGTSITKTVIEDKRPTDEKTSLAVLKQLLRTPGGKSMGRSALKSRNHPLIQFGLTNFSAQGTGVYTFNLALLSAIQSSTAGSVCYYAAAINPSSMSNWSPLSGLFDQYRIAKTSIEFIPVAINAGGVSDQVAIGAMAVCLDMDSNAAPASVDEVLQYNDAWCGSTLNPPGGSGLGYRLPSYTFTTPSSATALADGLGAWCDIATVATTGCYKVAVEYVKASTQVHAYVINHVVEFRSVR
jgi:hypothetical protein